jgi:hypothetical protein
MQGPHHGRGTIIVGAAPTVVRSLLTVWVGRTNDLRLWLL